MNLRLPDPALNHVPECHIHTFCEHFQGWWFQPFPGRLFQCLPSVNEPEIQFQAYKRETELELETCFKLMQ